jgi:molecular chaperone HtpG
MLVSVGEHMNRIPALLAYLQNAVSDGQYYSKTCELRDAVAGWLSYIPQTFPNYTRHTIDHSDRIIQQLSKLLFIDDDPDKPYIELTGVEGYVLCASALLHDSGMVASDTEKTQILNSDDWNSWITNGYAADRMAAIEAMRRANGPPNDQVRAFLADVQLRFLIAEFVRMRHHTRSATFLVQNQSLLGRFAWDDPPLIRTIANVCEGHGLTHSELEDGDRFPLVTDIRGEKANVRLLAILFRLGDLLDMESDRSCPLLLNAASPIPALSLPHWTQYQRITRRLTTPQVIEIVAECASQDEHRVLTDWCKWIELETQAARRILLPARRHVSWSPPSASVGERGTLQIRPAKNATYIPCDWRLILDEDAVLARLISGAYADELAWVRELIQNAIDATRCRFHTEMISPGHAKAWPHPVPIEIRDRFAIEIALEETEVLSEFSGSSEKVQVFSIRDSGIGMTSDVIQKYFLQVGRSFYVSPEFRHRFDFVPIGRNGIGFLSVFNVSDHVVVETRAYQSTDTNSLRLTLTGPRNYLLLETDNRINHGTTIEVRLKKPIDYRELRDRIALWCRRVEFPVHVKTNGTTSKILPEQERVGDLCGHPEPLIGGEGHFEIRRFPFASPTTVGEFYVFVLQEGNTESWASGSWATHVYKTSHPLAAVPKLPAPIRCDYGINYAPYGRYQDASLSISVRCDYRGRTRGRLLDRGSDQMRPDESSIDQILNLDSSIRETAEEIVRDHLEARASNAKADEWRYRQRMAQTIPLRDFWINFPETIRAIRNGEPLHVSLNSTQAFPSIVLFYATNSIYRQDPSQNSEINASETEVAASERVPFAIVASDVGAFADLSREFIFDGRVPIAARILRKKILSLTFERVADHGDWYQRSRSKHFFLEIENFEGVGIRVYGLQQKFSYVVILNLKNPLISWLTIAKENAQKGTGGLDENAYNTLLSHIAEAVGFGIPREVERVKHFVEGWSKLPGFDERDLPPVILVESFKQPY